ncbi:hypothetical protein MNBD_CHLOROFLEXI01-4409 [hydrothermal vent metagenome]|uniref:Uncharacterized protein n=1 Tax=hydrothermal vent metagenome TaxID=652676 RepID=A0A3B0UK05_9ZZZZ
MKFLYNEQENHQRLRRFSRFLIFSICIIFDKSLFSSGLSKLGGYKIRVNIVHSNVDSLRENYGQFVILLKKVAKSSDFATLYIIN